MLTSYFTLLLQSTSHSTVLKAVYSIPYRPLTTVIHTVPFLPLSPPPPLFGHSTDEVVTLLDDDGTIAAIERVLKENQYNYVNS